MTICRLIACCSILLLFFSASSAAQTDILNMSDEEFDAYINRDNLGAVIQALANEPNANRSSNYFGRLKQIIRYIESPAFPASPLETFGLVYDVATLGLERIPEDAKLGEEALPAQRDLCLDLINQRLTDIADRDVYAKLRARYGQSLVVYLESLKSQQIEGYRPKIVTENVPVPSLELGQQPSIAGMDPSAITDERLRSAYIADIDSNTANYLANQYQAMLRRTIETLQPSIEAFLKYQYASSPANSDELTSLLTRLDAAGTDHPK